MRNRRLSWKTRMAVVLVRYRACPDERELLLRCSTKGAAWRLAVRRNSSWLMHRLPLHEVAAELADNGHHREAAWVLVHATTVVGDYTTCQHDHCWCRYREYSEEAKRALLLLDPDWVLRSLEHPGFGPDPGDALGLGGP